MSGYVGAVPTRILALLLLLNARVAAAGGGDDEPAAGGGGTGMRRVRDRKTLELMTREAIGESSSAFGDGTGYI